MDMIYEIFNGIIGFVLLLFAGYVALESSIMVSEKKARYRARYRAGTHDYYDNPIEDVDDTKV
jgi:hypothetical protein